MHAQKARQNALQASLPQGEATCYHPKQWPLAAIQLRKEHSGLVKVMCQNSVPGNHKQSDHFRHAISLFLTDIQAWPRNPIFPVRTRAAGALPPKKSFQLDMQMFLSLSQLYL